MRRTVVGLLSIAILALSMLPVLTPQVKAQSSGGIPITTSPASDTSPAWSPDGGTIAFTRRPEGICCSAQVWKIGSGGSGEAQIPTEGPLDESPFYSPDSSKIVFSHWPSPRGDFTEIRVMNSDGSGVATIRSVGVETYGAPEWSHDGTKMIGHAYLHPTGFDCRFNDCGFFLWRMNPDGSSFEAISISGEGVTPSFSPDDSEIVFSKVTPFLTMSKIAIFRIADSTTTLLTSGPFDMEPHFSPDGSRILFSRCSGLPSFSTPCDLYTINRDGTGLTQLTFDGMLNTDPRFSPDGTKIAYSSSRSGNRDIWVLQLNIAPVAGFKFRALCTPFKGPGALSGCKPTEMFPQQVIRFDGTLSFDPDGTVVRWTWDFGDGNILDGTDSTPTHTYSLPGSYTLSLTVFDNLGASARVSKQLFVSPLEFGLFLEIDYMRGRRPSNLVLDYIQRYFRDRGFQITTMLEEVPLDSLLTMEEFWALEAQHNNVGDDTLGTGAGCTSSGDVGIYRSRFKYILYGARADSSNPPGCQALGFTFFEPHIHVFRDQDHVVGGNYIFIQFDLLLLEAQRLKASPREVELEVLMHELGHAIGIEPHDKNRNAVMVGSVDDYRFNGGLDEYYAAASWSLADLDFYRDSDRDGNSNVFENRRDVLLSQAQMCAPRSICAPELVQEALVLLGTRGSGDAVNDGRDLGTDPFGGDITGRTNLETRRVEVDTQDPGDRLDDGHFWLPKDMDSDWDSDDVDVINTFVHEARHVWQAYIASLLLNEGDPNNDGDSSDAIDLNGNGYTGDFNVSNDIDRDFLPTWIPEGKHLGNVRDIRPYQADDWETIVSPVLEADAYAFQTLVPTGPWW